MITQEQYYGGATIVQDTALFNLPVGGVRFVRAVGEILGGTWDFNLPPGPDITPGGPVFVISNGTASATIEIFRDDAISIGTIPSGSTGLVFLTDSFENNGAGQWYLGGNGTSGEVGDQADSTGFFYGTAPKPAGLESDLGDSENTPDQEHGLTMDFGGAIINVPPSVII